MSKIGFVLGATDHGPMILSRHDYAPALAAKNEPQPADWWGYVGVGYQLLETGTFDQDELDLLISLLPQKEGTLVLDVGANIGAFTVPLARHLTDWGAVIAFEPQERLYYALAGNVALNNCWNVRVIHAAIADKSGQIMIPLLDYTVPSNFGGVGLKSDYNDVGQKPTGSYPLQALAIDALNLPPVALMKVDVEGMELDVLHGAEKTIDRDKPIILVEYIKTGLEKLENWLDAHGYNTTIRGMNLLASYSSLSPAK